MVHIQGELNITMVSSLFNNYKTIITIKSGTPDLYYYCGSHSGMRGIETLAFQNLKTVEYKVLFNNDLADGEYVVKLIDDAGNELVESDDNKFKIETVVPVITPLALDDGLDTGLSNVDRATTILKPHFSFNSEAGLRVFIDRLMDNSYTGPIQNGPLVEGTDWHSNRQ